jgi:hypothetical protein
MLNTYPVYDGGRQEHYTSETLYAYLDKLKPGEIINDAAAQTIAEWWHSPGQPYTTMLSTMGVVDRYTTIFDFASPSDWTSYARELDALDAYIKDKISNAESSYRPCACDDCPDLVVGIPGELCSLCENEGCDAQGSECQRPDAYQD